MTSVSFVLEIYPPLSRLLEKSQCVRTLGLHLGCYRFMSSLNRESSRLVQVEPIEEEVGSRICHSSTFLTMNLFPSFHQRFLVQKHFRIYQQGFEPETRERFKELLKPEKPGEIFCKKPSPCWSKELYSVSASIQDLILIFS